MKQLILLLFIPFIFSLPASAKSNADEILKKMDELFRSDSSTATMQMEIQTPNWQRTMEMDMWTKGLDYAFILIKSPRKDRGVASLKRDAEMWNFFPKINKVIKIPPSMMMGSWMGSDFTNDDLVKESSYKNDYIAEVTAETATTIDIVLTPKASTVSLWGKILHRVDRKTYLPIEQSFFDEKGVKVRTMKFLDVKNLGGKEIPTTIELIPLTKEGHKTIVRYLKASFDVPVPDSTFTRANLQKRR